MKLHALCVALVGTAGLFASASALAGNVGYYNICGGAQAAHAAAITQAGHTPVAITTPNAASLSGLASLSVTNNYCDLTTYNTYLPDITNAVNAGMTLIVHDRTVTGAGSMLPGGAGINAVEDFENDADIQLPALSPIISGPGGTLTNTSLDGGTSSSHGYVTTASLPAGSASLATRTSATQAVTASWSYGSGKVVYSTIPLDYYLNGSGPNPPRDNFNTVYLPNLLAASLGAPGPSITCTSSGYTGTKLTWCKNICEMGYTGATLDMWIHRWINRYRDLPYCALQGGGEQPVPTLK